MALDAFSQSFKQAKAPWLTRAPLAMSSSLKNLLNEIYKNFRDYGSSPYAALQATEHICSQDSGKSKLIRGAKDQMVKIALKHQQNDKKDDVQFTSADYLQILAIVSANVKSRATAAAREAINFDQILGRHGAAKPSQDDPAWRAWEDKQEEYLQERSLWQSQAREAKEILDTQQWREDDVQEATKSFVNIRKSIAAAAFPTASGGAAPSTNNGDEAIRVWNMLVKHLVLQHKSQGAGEVSFGDSLTPAQVNALRSIAQDEVASDQHVRGQEDIFSFTSKLQEQERFATWIFQALLPESEIAPEQQRLDGVLFRALMKSLPDHLLWTADSIKSEAERSQGPKLGNMFMRLVSKIYESGDRNPQGKDGRGESKGTGADNEKGPEARKVRFVGALKSGRLEKDPNAAVTQEHRREKVTSETTTTFKPRKKRKADSDTSADEGEEGVHLVEEDAKTDEYKAIISLIAGLEEKISSMNKRQNTGRSAAQPVIASRPPTPQKGLCYQFENQGACKRENCTFLHIARGGAVVDNGRRSPGPAYQHPSPARSQAQEGCRDYQKGACTRGAGCRYSHDQPSGGGAAAHSPQSQGGGGVKDNAPARACREYWLKSACDRGQCSWEHGKVADDNAPVCNAFLNQKHCHFAWTPAGCRFSHPRQPPVPGTGANKVPMGKPASQRELASAFGDGSQKE